MPNESESDVNALIGEITGLVQQLAAVAKAMALLAEAISLEYVDEGSPGAEFLESERPDAPDDGFMD